MIRAKFQITYDIIQNLMSQLGTCVNNRQLFIAKEMENRDIESFDSHL